MGFRDWFSFQNSEDIENKRQAEEEAKLKALRKQRVTEGAFALQILFFVFGFIILCASWNNTCDADLRPAVICLLLTILCSIVAKILDYNGYNVAAVTLNNIGGILYIIVSIASFVVMCQYSKSCKETNEYMYYYLLTISIVNILCLVGFAIGCFLAML
jgi:uncharacterized membrane protein